MSDEPTLAFLTTQISRLNRALGHRRGTPRVTPTTATPDQLPLVLELEAWERAHQHRLNLDSACAEAALIAAAAAQGRLGQLFYSDLTRNPWGTMAFAESSAPAPKEERE